MRQDLYQMVTDRILAELEQGAVPWIKPWKSRAGGNQPRNAVTGRPYSGSNVVLLWMVAEANGWSEPRWLTYKQAKEAGGHVRKGEHGTEIIFIKRIAVKDNDLDNAEKTKMIGMLRSFTVFNVAQCDELPDRIVHGDAAAPVTTEERDRLADEFVQTTGADIREGNGEAYFVPSKDFISMPAFAAFKSVDHFYATEFHELGHWTGHKDRLNRDLKTSKGTQLYAAEELVAELTSAFICAEFGFEGELRHAGYIAHWIKLLKDDAKAFVSAASKAQKAADYLRGLALKEEEEPIAQAA